MVEEVSRSVEMSGDNGDNVSLAEDRLGANYMAENGDFCDPAGRVIYEKGHPFNPGSHKRSCGGPYNFGGCVFLK